MKTNLTEKEINEIINLYQSSMPSTHALGELYKVGHKKISKILKSNEIVVNKRGAQIKHGNSDNIENSKVNILVASDGKQLVAKCKKTGTIINDPNNLSGGLTRHILTVYGDVPIPTNTYQRKKYEMENNKKWFEEYFDIIEVNQKENRKCKLCKWITEDITNRTGCFQNHIITIHNVGLSEYLDKFPEDIFYHKTYIKQKELANYENHVVCEMCGQKLGSISSTHLIKHHMTIDDYKARFPNVATISNKYKHKLQEIYETGLKLYEGSFTSKGEREVFEFVRSLGIIAKARDKKFLKGTEIDILIHSLKIGIEFNGLYWHSEKMGKTRQVHLSKTKLMNEKGYNLIHIFEDEWINNKELVKNKIAHILGYDTSPIIGARKCLIGFVDKDEKSLFLNKNHIQGNDRATICIGARYNDKLVAVMCFDNHRNMNQGKKKEKNDPNIYNLSRFATDINYRVVGVADKLLKFFINNYHPIKILSFGDIRWVLDSNNNLYTKLGFKLAEVLEPDYKYFKSSVSRFKRLHKFGYGKSSLRKKFPNLGLDFSKSTTELMKEMGFVRIWDCGLFRYELVIPQPS